MKLISNSTNQALAKEASRRTLRYVIIAILALLAVVAIHFETESRSERTVFETREQLNTELGRLTIAKSLDGVVADLLYLADQYQRQSKNSERSGLNVYADDLAAFVARQRIYDQVRFIDLKGREKIRVNYRQDEAQVVSDSELQDKSDRYYVRKTLKLDSGQIYVSPLDLNVEHGKVEIPAKPVIRFATPVFDTQGRQRGILVLNYLGARLINAFRESSINIADHVHLLNDAGYWLSSPESKDEWGFMRGQVTHFGTRYPMLWKTVRNAQQGQFEANDFIATFTTVRALRHLSTNPTTTDVTPAITWKIVSLFPLSALQSSPSGFFKRHYPLYLAMLVLLIGAGILLGRMTAKHQFAEARLVFERGFRSVLQDMSLNVVALDTNGKIVFHNETLRALVGWDRGELKGRDWVQAIVAPESRDLSRDRTAALLSGMSPSEHSIWLLSRDGERHFIDWHETPMTDSDGRITGITLLGQETTEARAAAERAALLTRAIEQSPATVMITDATGSIEYVNPKFSELSGYQLDEVQGRNPRLLKSGHSTEVDYAELWETISAGGEWRGTLCNRKKSGELYWEDAVLCGVRNLEGEIAHFVAIKVDITARKKLQDRFRHCVESAPYAMILNDREGRIILVNKETERMFGYSREVLFGNNVERLIPVKQRQVHQQTRSAFVAAGRSRTMGLGREVVGLHQDGSTFPVEIGLHTFETTEGRMSLASITNISERKRLESEIAWRDRRLAQNDALIAVGRMANMVAHDIGNPLSSIKMGLQIIGKRQCVRQDMEAFELNSIALEQVGFVEEIVEDLMTYSRTTELNLRWLAIPQILEASLSTVHRRIENRKVNVIQKIQPDLPLLHGDRTHLRRAFSNLIMNALDAVEANTKRAPELSITIHTTDDRRQKIRIDICDNANGVADNNLKRLFEPFFTTREHGTGLGLAITLQIVEQHGGSVEIVPGDKVGTRASIILPIDLRVDAATTSGNQSNTSAVSNLEAHNV